MEQEKTTFRHAAEYLERAWQFDENDDERKHGFLFAMRYNKVDLEAIDSCIAMLSTLPSAEKSISGESLNDYRRFVSSAWTIPMWLSGRKSAGVFNFENGKQRDAYMGLNRQISRILGQHKFS